MQAAAAAGFVRACVLFSVFTADRLTQFARPTRVLIRKNLIQRVEMEETIMHEAPFCLLFTIGYVLLVCSQFSAFDASIMASVTRNLYETYEIDNIEYLKDASEVVETLEGSLVAKAM